MFEAARRRGSELEITIENRDTGEKYEMTANDAIKDTVNGNLERIRAMVANAGDETTIAEIVEETERLLQEIKGRGSVALRNELREALKVALQPQLPTDAAPSGEEPNADAAPSGQEPNADAAPSGEGAEGAEGAGEVSPRGNGEADDEDDDEGDGEPLVIPADVAALITEASAHVSAAVNLGVEAQKIAEHVSQLQLTMRKKTPHKAGVPDLIAHQKYTRNTAALVYKEVADQITDEDVDKVDILKSLKRAVRNKNSDVLVGYLRGLDADKEEGFKEVQTYYPEAAAAYLKAKENETEEKPASLTEAVYSLYASKGIELPRKGRTELERERRAAAKALAAGDDSKLTPEARLENYFTTIKAELDKAEKNAAKLNGHQKRKVRKRLNELAKRAEALAASI
ncbi:hypothetical protein QWJ26_07130 [Streptomyces sp. CSDS2]|uniref:hypothetical protein n=1 Tax=Streptomyces sp. CSDS2 TaxID=3055051 RepID=UPI0025AFA346|nr:hypothetical protein [Streptomyces sp. CSDS2]MDN3259590.1 hypothetical protein [Streptomyces sp. CSDS2]